MGLNGLITAVSLPWIMPWVRATVRELTAVRGLV